MFLCIGLGTYILYRVQTGQSIIPSFAAGGNIVQIDDLDSRFKFVSGPKRIAAGYPHWDKVSNGGTYVLRGGTAQQCNGLNSVGCYATLDLTSQNFNIDQITLGFSMAKNRTSADIFIDDQKIAQVNSYAVDPILDYRNYKLWTSPKDSITCGKHKIKIMPNQKTGTAQKAFTLDFVDVRKCTPTNPPPTGDWQKIDDKDSRFNYGGNNPNRPGFPYWDIWNDSALSGGSAHACKTSINMGCQTLLPLTANFNQLQIRAIAGHNGTSADVYVDNQKIGEANGYKEGTDGIGTKPLNNVDWASPEVACGTHVIKIVPNGRLNSGRSDSAKSFTMDYLQIKSCTPNPTDITCATDSDCNNGKKCLMDTKTCRPVDQAHLGCYQNSCAYLNRSGNNTDGCQTVGGSCSTPRESFLTCVNNACTFSSTATSNDPSCVGKNNGDSCTTTHLICLNNACATSNSASTDDPTCSNKDVGETCGVPTADLECQGNTDAPARCFDCKRDLGPSSTTSEINILDFSCFAKFYGKEVGKN